nr:hypothetical protein [Pandoravirus aubagnensis]
MGGRPSCRFGASWASCAKSLGAKKILFLFSSQRFFTMFLVPAAKAALESCRQSGSRSAATVATHNKQKKARQQRAAMSLFFFSFASAHIRAPAKGQRRRDRIAGTHITLPSPTLPQPHYCACCSFFLSRRRLLGVLSFCAVLPSAALFSERLFPGFVRPRRKRRATRTRSHTAPQRPRQGNNIGQRREKKSLRALERKKGKKEGADRHCKTRDGRPEPTHTHARTPVQAHTQNSNNNNGHH